MVGFFPAGESVSEPTLLSLKENLHTQGKERVGEEARDRQTERGGQIEKKTKAPFQSFRVTAYSADIIKVRRELGNSRVPATSFRL